MNNRIEIGNRITELRKLKGLTQNELAEKARITQNNLSRIETGKYSPGLDILMRIADALDYELFYNYTTKQK